MPTLKTMVTDYPTAKAYANTLKNPAEGRLIDPFARIKQTQDKVMLEISGRPVLIYYPENMIEIRTYDVFTAKTIYRINKHTPEWFKMIQLPYERDLWHVQTPHGMFPFYEGMVLDVNQKQLYERRMNDEKNTDRS